MRWSALLFLAVLACGKDSSGPGGIDPTLQISNQLSVDSVFFTWRDGQGIVGADTILPGHVTCERFLARPDSAYFEAHARNNGGLSTYLQPWFDPTARDAWTMRVSEGSSGSPVILVTDVSPTLPC